MVGRKILCEDFTMKEEVVILLAEDDPGHARLIKKNLSRVGVQNEIVHFANGEETLEFFNKNKKKQKSSARSYVLLLDIKMPKVSGIEVLRNLKQSNTLKNIPVIMITTSANPDEVQQCYDFGCICYIKKPLDYQKLKQTVEYLGLFLKAIEIPLY